MTLVVSIGLERFYYDQHQKEREKAVLALVDSGYTNYLCEVFAEGGRETLASASIFRVQKTNAGIEHDWLTDTEAKPIIADIQKVYNTYDTYASFSWKQLDDFDADYIHDLALVLDVPEQTYRVTLPGIESQHSLISLRRSLLNWQGRNRQAQTAIAFHKLAQKHRLVVHSA